jgi:hypothetical protein
MALDWRVGRRIFSEYIPELKKLIVIAFCNHFDFILPNKSLSFNDSIHYFYGFYAKKI